MLIRAFVAVSVRRPQRMDLLLNDLRSLCSGRTVKPTAPENLHLTLRFLGDIEQAQVNSVIDAMNTAVYGVGVFDFKLENVGAFPRTLRPTVLWVGAADQGQLGTIVEQLNNALADMGLGPENRPWHPHVTIARIKSHPPTKLLQFITDHKNDHLGSIRVSSIELLRSDLQPNGPAYAPLACVPLIDK